MKADAQALAQAVRHAKAGTCTKTHALEVLRSVYIERDTKGVQAMSDETYNGWKGNGTRSSAYATWRVALEVFDGSAEDAGIEGQEARAAAEILSDYVNEYIDEIIPDEQVIVRGWLGAFLDEVNWEEIAENLLETD